MRVPTSVEIVTPPSKSTALSSFWPSVPSNVTVTVTLSPGATESPAAMPVTVNAPSTATPETVSGPVPSLETSKVSSSRVTWPGLGVSMAPNTSRPPAAAASRPAMSRMAPLPTACTPSMTNISSL